MHAASHTSTPIARHIPLMWLACLAVVSGAGCGDDDTTATATAGNTSMSAAAGPKPINWRQPVVRIDTNRGAITLKLDGDRAPGTVRNFLNYASEGFFDNTIVHYIAPGKMIVAGGYTSDRQPKPARTPILNEAHNGLKNVRGTIAMTRNPTLIDSATSQFFINLEDAPQRDHHGESADQYGYCVFGQVTDGLDVADQISQSPITNLGGDLQETPDPPVVITSIRVVP